jgi:hypothetical protein
MSGKKMFATRIDADLLKKLKHLSVDADNSIANLFEEAVKDLLKKYEKLRDKTKRETS